MAAATATPTVVSTDWTGNELIVRGTVAFSAAADTYTTKGVPMSFAGVQSGSLPTEVRFYVTSAPTNLYYYNYAAGTTQANGAVQIFTGAAAQTGLTEYTSGSALTNPFLDSISFVAYFPRL